MAHKIYMVRGRTVTTAATADHAIAVLWNPSSTVRLVVREIHLCANAAPASSASVYLRRTTTIGTAASTVTPTIENDTERLFAPASGALLGLAAYTGQPTFVTAGHLWGWTLAAVAASGFMLPLPQTIDVPAGTGLALVTGNAVAVPASDATFVWEE